MRFLPKNEPDNSSDLSQFESSITLNSDFVGSGIIVSDDNSTAENSSGSSTQSSNSSSKYNNSTDTATDASSDNQSSKSGDSSASSSASENTDSSTAQNSQEQSSATAAETKTEAVYIYRDAVAADCYPEGSIPAYPIGDVIAITGVATAASDGIYVIPEEIDGKRVGAIMQSAFCDTAICSTVKKVVVPTTVKTIWENAFADCYNLTDIYLYGKTINIFESSFADTSHRTGTLTIHCAYDCKTFGFSYYRNVAYMYNAEYQEWNGGEYN